MTEKSANLSEIDPNFGKVEKISLKDQCSDEDIDAAKDEGYVGYFYLQDFTKYFLSVSRFCFVCFFMLSHALFLIFIKLRSNESWPACFLMFILSILCYLVRAYKKSSEQPPPHP